MPAPFAANPESKAFDLRRARAETPGCQHVAHFNNAGAALMPQPVLDAYQQHISRESQIGGYEAAAEAQPRLDAVYASVARLLGCAPAEVALVESGTRAWDMVAYALPLRPGDRLLTAASEYSSNYIGLHQIARRTGATLEVIPNDATGQVDVAAAERLLTRGRAGLLAITHLPGNNGLVNPAAALGRLARAAGVPFLLDAVQSAGQLPLDVAALGCDFLVGTGRKYLRGPRGTGFLYVRQPWLEQLEPPFLDNHAAHWLSNDQVQIRPDARRFESWEYNWAARLGLGAAVDYALSWGLETTWRRVRELAARLRAGLGALPHVQLLDTGAEQSGIVTFVVPGLANAQVQARLAGLGINVSTPATTPFDRQTRLAAPNLVRASVHYYNSEEEVERLLEAVQGLRSLPLPTSGVQQGPDEAQEATCLRS